MQNIDEEGKARLVLALCEGKITAEMYEQTMGESITQTLRQWNKSAAEQNREAILERERRGLLTHEECMFVLGEGPEPPNYFSKKEKMKIDHRKNKRLNLKKLNDQTHEERRHREMAKRLVTSREVWIKKTIDIIGRYENGEISRVELEKEMWNTYPRILFHLYDMTKFIKRYDIAVIAKILCLSAEECQKIFEEEVT